MWFQFGAFADGILSTYRETSCCTDTRDEPGETESGCWSQEALEEPIPDWRRQDVHRVVSFSGHMSEPNAVTSAAKHAKGVRETSDANVPEGGSAAALEEALALRELMKLFVQEMMHGKVYNVVMEDGRTEAWTLSITTALQYIKLESNGITHDILLRNIKKVVPGKLADGNFTPGALDDCCTTVVLKNNECVTFRLGSIQERDDFTKCVKVLVLALD
uniref:Uncharacterized protein n=1 Tax=Noctiluca scintillans TaxID=2966 RepID=A0A7S1FFH2_NOCSC|mmetsp:Transcript_59188/g.157534  ORF Transcript_59188/g.157534 Transcript_59188/m.157534 type:complete len:218 (+) Transcript_59188:68-721(+)